MELSSASAAMVSSRASSNHELQALASSCQPFVSPFVSAHHPHQLRVGVKKAAAIRCKHNAEILSSTYGGEVEGNDEVELAKGRVERRKLLLATTMGGLLGAGQLYEGGAALGAPVQPPDLRQCETSIDPGNGASPVSCCLPVSTTIKDYVLPSVGALRTRPSAHLGGADYLAKYKRAYQLLRALPADDPRQFDQQANVHCAFCDAAYDEKGTRIEYQVHNSWLFFPWHRWYLYFHERMLAKLLGDDTFALPFWNWDAAAGYTLPPMYTDPQSPLYNANRNPAHGPPRVVDLNYNFTDRNRTPAAQLAANNSIMYRQLVSNAKTPALFFGQAYRQGDEASPGGGTVENVPHGTVHSWTGNPSNPNDEDMGALYSAGRDPIFFAHHSNVDRLWEVWKGLGGRRTDLTDPDYLNATFLFYDENAQLVRVKIGDSLDTRKLGYVYQNVPNPWLTRPSSSSSSSASASAAAMSSFHGPAGGPPPALAGHLRQKLKAGLREFKERASKTIDKIDSALVRRPKKVKADDFEEEILVLQGVQVPVNERVKFDVYINLPDADPDVGCDIPEYAGSFFNVPHVGMIDKMAMKMGSGTRKSNFRLGIGEVLKELGIEDDDSFSITIVPRSKTSFPISIDAVKLEYE